LCRQGRSLHPGLHALLYPVVQVQGLSVSRATGQRPIYPGNRCKGSVLLVLDSVSRLLFSLQYIYEDFIFIPAVTGHWTVDTRLIRSAVS
jgi:hypothetical protein